MRGKKKEKRVFSQGPAIFLVLKLRVKTYEYINISITTDVEEQLSVVKVGYQFITIVLEIGSAETASAASDTCQWTISASLRRRQTGECILVNLS